jgi:hypothetical protein
VIEPLAVLNAPPVTLAPPPLAMLVPPPRTLDWSPLAVLAPPPLTLAKRPLAVLPKPPVTLATKPLAVFSSPLMTLSPHVSNEISLSSNETTVGRLGKPMPASDDEVVRPATIARLERVREDHSGVLVIADNQIPKPSAIAIVVGPAPAADNMNIGAAENDIRSYHTNLRVGIDLYERTKQERMIGLDCGQLALQRGVGGRSTNYCTYSGREFTKARPGGRRRRIKNHPLAATI